MKIAMIGSGYVGLVSGACFANYGHNVVCVDKDENKIKSLLEGVMPIYEPGLDDLVARNVKNKNLSFTTDLPAAIADADAVFIAVGTPSRRGDGHADLSFVYDVAKTIAIKATKDLVIVTKSTVPVGTGDNVQHICEATRSDVSFDIVSNPEFLREGAAIADFTRPDRVVVGCNSEHAREVMAAIYRPLALNELPIVFVDRRTSELIKYASNAFLATKITFINEIADLCEKTGANVQDVARGMGLDKRIGPKFLHAGPGYGGSCFPKDTQALVKTAHDHSVSLRIVEAVVAVNDQRKRAMGRKVIAACGGDVRGKRVGLLGLTFKPNTDDMRDSPAISIAQALMDAGADIVAYDPIVWQQADDLIPGIEAASNPYVCAEGADALVIITEWDEFRALDLGRVKKFMRQPILVDLRNVYRPDDVRAHGFQYTSVGRD